MSALAATAGAAVVHAAWQASALAGAVWLCQPLLARRSAAERVFVAYMTLLASALLPVFTALAFGAPQGPVALGGLAPLAGELWAAGAALNGLRLLHGWRGTRRLVADAVVDPRLAERAAELAARVGLSQVRVSVTDRLQGPAVVGVLRPVVLVPRWLAASLGSPELDALLAHELAHLARRDPVLNIVQRGIESLLFFHPAVWWLSSVVDAEREHAADDRALQAGVSPAALARGLEQVASSERPRLALAASGGLLLHRVRRLLVDATPMRWPGLGAGRWVGALLLLALLGVPSTPTAHCVDPQVGQLVALSHTNPAERGEREPELERTGRRSRPQTDDRPEWRTRLVVWAARRAGRAVGGWLLR